jgi:UDP-glucuronate 4-epimerase
MTVLVTGAAGFVGAHLVKSLHETGESVVGLDSFNDYYSPELKEKRVESLIPNNIEILDLNLTNTEKLSNLVAKLKPRTVYHLAAQAGVRLQIKDTDQYVQSNLVGFSNILECAVENQVANFVYASSSSVYGNSFNTPYTETDRNLSPISFYGASKLSNELLASALVRGSSTNARGLRFFTVYGPWGRPDMAYFRIAEALINSNQFNLFGDGEVIRDFTYIDDIIHSTLLLTDELNSKKETGLSDVVNIGGGKPSSMKQLITAFEAVSERKLQINQLAHVEKDVNQTIASLKLQNQLINFTPKVSLEQGVEQVFKWANSPLVTSKLNAWTKSVN